MAIKATSLSTYNPVASRDWILLFEVRMNFPSVSEIPIGVTEALQKVLADNPEAADEIGKRILHYMQEYARVMELANGDVASVAHSFHSIIDGFIQEATEKRDVTDQGPACKKGCSHCCYLEVHVTPHEGQLLLQVMKEKGIEIDEESLKLQAKVARWRQLAYKARRCVFLSEEGECRVYDYRPMSCRKYLVFSEPEKCNSGKYPGGEVGVLTANKAEIVASAIFSICDSDTIPKQLQKLRGK